MANSRSHLSISDMDSCSKWTLNQGKALIIAHSIDSKLKTEYGVRIVVLHY